MTDILQPEIEIPPFELDRALTSISESQDTEANEREQAEARAKLLASLGDQDVRAKVEMGRRLIENSETEDGRAEGYYLTGDIETAIAMTTQDAKRAEYQSRIDAVTNPVDCSCKPKKFTQEKFVYNDRVYMLVKCPKCKGLSAG